MQNLDESCEGRVKNPAGPGRCAKSTAACFRTKEKRLYVLGEGKNPPKSKRFGVQGAALRATQSSKAPWSRPQAQNTPALTKNMLKHA